MVMPLLVIVLVAVVVVVTVHHFLKSQEHRKQLNKIPSPHGYPLVGQLPYIVGPLDKSWGYFRRLAERHYPIYKFQSASYMYVVLLNPDDIKILLTNKNSSRKPFIYRWFEAWFGMSLLTSSGEKWHSRRKMLAPAFHFNILQYFVEIFVEHSELLNERLINECDKPHTDVVPIISQFTLQAISETAMGTRLDETKVEIKEYTDAVHRMGEIFYHRIKQPLLYFDAIYNLTPTKKEQDRLIRILHNFSRSIIKERKSNFKEVHIPSKNAEISSKKKLAMLDLLISAQNQGVDISDENIREEVDTFIFAGHDTTTAATCFTLMLLANYPHIQQKVVDELKNVLGPSRSRIVFQDLAKLQYLEQVIKESLRMYPSVPQFSRFTEEDILTSTGYMIPANICVQVHVFDLHHNPEFYPDPYKFDPDRFSPGNSQGRHPFAYIPFSAGSRNCIGQKYALMEMKTAIASILLKFVLKPVDTPSDLKLLSHLGMKSLNGIKIKFEMR